MDMNKVNDKIEILSSPEQVDMADDWYQFASIDHFWMKSRFRAIESKLTKIKIGSKFLEIGCGHGVVIKQFEERFDAEVDGCDLNMLALNQIKETKGRIFCLDIFDKPKELLDMYDGVLLLDVIEHIDNDYYFLENSLTYVKKGGLVIINVPALHSLFSKYDISAGHKRRYNKRMIRGLFKKCNIEEVSISYWGLSLIPIGIIRKIMLNFVRKEKVIYKGFETPNQSVNKILNWILAIENKLIKSPNLGTSLVAIGSVKGIKK
jgi:SAM-dependent methyltransferase